MVKKIKNKGNVYYKCEACGFAYKNIKIAKKCEDYCNKHHGCSLDIPKNAIKLEG